jgi:ATP-binding cassette, subfamily G (WHITE), member 2
MALIIVILVYVIMMLISGFLTDVESIFNWLSWIRWISAFHYAANVLNINEFRGIRFCLSNMTDLCPTAGEEVLTRKALDFNTDWDLWKYFLALTMMAISFLLLALIQLFRLKKTK